MGTTDRDISLLFYRYLCDVVGSEDVVRTRRQLYNTLDYVREYHLSTAISSGSKAEGLDLKGSDYDEMRVAKRFPVYQRLLPRNQTPYEVPFIMNTEETKPGFTRLILYNNNHIYKPIVKDVHETLNGVTYISSKRFREHFLPPGAVLHGPCSSTPDELVDLAACLHSEEWIEQAQPWLYRPRSLWPGNTLIDTIQQYGVLFVPIGNKGSPYEDYEWRISFSVAEKQLIHSFSHTQLLCYALLKIVLKDIIKEKHRELLCSYFLKTILFWVSEETAPSAWKPENLLQRFMDCFRRLTYCVEYTTCLHYFIPENNFFEERFNGSQQKDLLRTLSKLYKSGWVFVLHTPTLQSFQEIFQGSPDIRRQDASALSAIPYCNILVYCKEHLNNALSKAVFGCTNLPGKQFYGYYLSLFSQRMAQSISFPESNKEYYKSYRRCQAHLLIGTNHDAVSGWLLLASFYYTQKQYEICMQIINNALQQCTPDKVCFDFDTEMGSRQAFIQQISLHQRYRFLAACKREIVHNVIFEEQYTMLPNLLHRFMGKYIYFIFMAPVVFAHFLLFVCQHDLSDRREKLRVLRDLEMTVRERYFVINRQTERTAYVCLHLARRLMNDDSWAT